MENPLYKLGIFYLFGLILLSEIAAFSLCILISVYL